MNEFESTVGIGLTSGFLKLGLDDSFVKTGGFAQFEGTSKNPFFEFTPTRIRPVSMTTLISQVYVFVVGGGSYVEYQNLMTYAEQHPDKRIVYGSSEMMDSSNFLEQLTKLGGASS